MWKRVELGQTGEPGIYFTNDKDYGCNPCCEISLRPFQFCNLTEVNVSNVKTTIREKFILIDKEGRVRSGIDINGNPYGSYDGTNDADIKTLVKDIRVLMAEYKQKENQNE